MVQQLSRNKVIPTLSRESLEPPDAENKEAWAPRWQCFCCHDTGIVNGNLVRLVIPDYNPIADKRPLCQHCNINDRYHSDDLPEYIAESHDYRFTKDICLQLHQHGKKDWDDTLKMWNEKRKRGIIPELENQKIIAEALGKKFKFSPKVEEEEDVDF